MGTLFEIGMEDCKEEVKNYLQQANQRIATLDAILLTYCHCCYSGFRGLLIAINWGIS